MTTISCAFDKIAIWMESYIFYAYVVTNQEVVEQNVCCDNKGGTLIKVSQAADNHF